MNPDPFENFLARLQGVRRIGRDKATAFCPLHENPPDGHKPSLSVARGDGGRVLLKCLGGCATANVAKAAGLEMSDLFADTTPPKGRTARPWLVTTYPYRDENGTVLFEVCRYVPKDFRQRRPDGNGGWIWNLDGVRRVLYRLPELLAADPAAWCFIVEGEKDADALGTLGLVTTTCSGGAGKWGRITDDSALHGRRVCILPDRDDPGRKHALDVARALHGKAADVRIMELPDVGGVKAKDVSDWLDAQDAREPQDLASTLAALADAAPPWTPTTDCKPPADERRTGGPVLTCLADVKPEAVAWLWAGRIPLGKVTLVFGDPGLGKSFLTLDIAARVSNNLPWPDRPDDRAQPGGVILLSAEDDPADTIRPRLEAAGADTGRVVILRGVKTASGAGMEHFNLSRNLLDLEDALHQTADVRLVVIDPISAYLGGADSHKNADIRALLAPLADLAARHRVAVLCVSHMNKGMGGRALYRATGSLAFIAAARAGWLVIPDTDDPKRRLFLPAKMNLAEEPTGLAYSLESVDLEGIGPVGRVAWESGPIRMTADDALAAAAADPEDRGARNLAADWLTEVLAAGPMKAAEVKQAAKDAGIAWRTVKRAQTAAGAKPRRRGFGPGAAWYWELSQGPDVSTSAIECQADRANPIDSTENA